MKKEKIQLKCKVNGDFSPYGLPRIFVAFHPEDISNFDLIQKELLSTVNCAVYYHNYSFEVSEADIDDYSLLLNEMKLFVFIISTKFLSSTSIAKSFEYGFAFKNHIPILPIATERNLEDYFSKEMNRIEAGFGDIQLINYTSNDTTEISFREKLKRDLSSILVSNSDIDRIRNAFHAQVFLSYRKCDRKYANELMRNIHSIPSLQGVAIWYDEYITTGEKWSSQIYDALFDSDIFLLMISPSITEPDNYVVKVEYPAAKKHKIPIVSVSKLSNSESIDYTYLKKTLPDIDEIFDGNNINDLEQALSAVADNGVLSPERSYLLGLAFFGGIGVEKNSKIALELIFSSAKSGLFEAIKKLSDIFWNGDGVEINRKQSISWTKQLIPLCKKNLSEISNDIGSICKYLDTLQLLSNRLFNLSSYREALSYALEIYRSTSEYLFSNKYDLIHDYLISSCDILGKLYIRLGKYSVAEKYFNEYCDNVLSKFRKDNQIYTYHNLSVGYERLGEMFYQSGEYIYAEKWCLKALKIREDINEQLENVDSAHSLSCIYLLLGDINTRNKNYENAESFFERARIIRKRILEAKHTSFSQSDYGETLISIGTIKLLSGEKKEASRYFKEASEIFCHLSETYQTIEYQRTYSVILNRQGKIASEDKLFHEAIEYYSKSLIIRKTILDKIRVDLHVFDYAITLVFMAYCYQNLFEKEKAKDLFEEAVEVLLEILGKDKRGDWHILFADAAFQRFKLFTFSGKKYLKYAIESYKWLIKKFPDNSELNNKFDLFISIYQRCYSD